MLSSSARCSSHSLSRQQAHAHTRHGGNLAPANTQSRGHSSFFGQTPHDFGADHANRHESGASLPARGAGAAMDRRSPSAESRPFLPFVQINHVAHAVLLSGAKATGNGFARVQIRFAP